MSAQSVHGVGTHFGEDLLAVKDQADREMYRCKKARKAAMERAGSGRP